MAYNTQTLFNKAKKIIQKNPMLIYVEELAAELGISRECFYDHFPNDSDKSDTLKDLLQENKTKTKRGLRTKWIKANNATTEIALYKLLATDEEKAALNNSKLEIANPKGETFKTESVINTELLEALEEYGRRTGHTVQEPEE